MPETIQVPTIGSQFITADHWHGDGVPVVLAHGGGQTRHSWGGTAAALAERGHRVVSIDLRGHGDSAWSTDGAYAMADYTADAASVIEWIGGSVAWVGASLGGMTGLHAVDTHPERFGALVLVDITPRPAKAGVNRILEFMSDRADTGFASLDEAADAIAAYQPHRKRPTDLSGLSKNLRLGDDGRWRWHWDPAFLDSRAGGNSEHARDRHHDELEVMARRITIPTLLVRGRLSDLVTQDEVDAFLDMVPHAHYVDVKDAAHMIAGDKNDVFTDAVVSFLDGDGATGAPFRSSASTCENDGMSSTTSEELHTRIVGQNIPKRFLANLERNGDVTVLKWKDANGEWASWTLAELAEQAARLTSALLDLGVGKGDKVVMMISNRVEFHALDLAVLFCGATPVSIYNSSAPDQIQYLINDCGASVAILENTTFLDRFESVRDKIPSIRHIAMIDAPDDVSSDIIRYSDMLAFEPADLAAAAETAALDDLATIIYTSGTTGPPKGVMLSHGNVAWTLESVGQSMRDQTDIGDFAGKRHLSYLPMAHVMERLLGHYYLLDFATEVTCLPDTTKIAAYLGEVHPNVFIGVPRVWEKLYAGVNAALAADPEKLQQFNDGVAAAIPITERMTDGTATEEDVATWNFLDEVGFKTVRGLIGLDQVEIGISGAAPIPADILSWFRAIGVPLTEGYGMSETTAVLSWASATKAGYVGKAATGVEIKIADDGEVLARGGNMFVGYLGLPDKTAETIDDDGWVHTGDIGVLDDDGFLKIVDRKKELIITAGGKNISPANLEAALKMIPLVGQACAVGEQKPFVAALVVLDPDAARAWATEHSLSGDDASMKALAENPEVIAEIEAGLVDVMSDFNNAESVKKVKVLGEEWMPDTELLTPTSKLKRRGILAMFADEIDALYAK